MGKETCLNCGGGGEVKVHYGDCDIIDCQQCKGTGEVDIDTRDEGEHRKVRDAFND